jgi:general secretion pathway protein D
VKRVTLLTALALACAVPGAAQQTLNLRDADIRAYIQDVSRATGRTFIIDPRVTGKVSVVSERPLNRTEYFELFLATLRANGFVVVPATGGAYRVQPAFTAASSPTVRGTSDDRFVTEVIRLDAIDAASVIETVRPLVSKDGQVTANRSGNSIVVADFADNVRRIRSLLGQLDRDRASTRVLPLRNAGAREIAQSLTQLVGPRGEGNTGVTIVAVDSSNAIALRGDPATVARLVQVAEDLDRRAAAGTDVRVLFLEHADAEKLLPVLQQLVGQAVTLSSTASTPSTPTPSAVTPTPATTVSSVASAGGGGGGNGGALGRAVVTRYEGANALIIAAPSDVQRTLGEVVRQLDTRREQVLVEAIIVEISDQAARRLGVQFLLAGEPGSNIPFAATNYSNAAPNILTLGAAVAARELNTTTTVVNGNSTTTTTNSGVSDQLAQAAINSIIAAGGGFGGIATNVGRNGVFGAIINAVRSDTESNILSTPSVMTLDNQEAKLLVGQEIPITTGQALGDNFDNAFRTVQRQNVGIQLEVKPQINAGGAIKLFLRQEVSSIAGPVSNDNSELILNKREIETTVTVDDGEIIALGGLLDDNERKTIERIPILSSIPGIGELFKSRARSRTKTNLMVFIRPTILRSAADAQRLAAQRYGYVRDTQLQQNPKQEPSLDELVRDYMGTTAPVAPPPAPARPAAAAPAATPATGTTTTITTTAPAQPAIIVPQVKTTTTIIQTPVQDPK